MKITEKQATQLAKLVVLLAITLVLGAISGGAWKSFEEYYDLTHAFMLSVTFAAALLGTILLCEELWPTNKLVYWLRRRLKTSVLIAFFGGPLVSFAGALPVFLIRLSL